MMITNSDDRDKYDDDNDNTGKNDDAIFNSNDNEFEGCNQ